MPRPIRRTWFLSFFMIYGFLLLGHALPGIVCPCCARDGIVNVYRDALMGHERFLSSPRAREYPDGICRACYMARLSTKNRMNGIDSASDSDEIVIPPHTSDECTFSPAMFCHQCGNAAPPAELKPLFCHHCGTKLFFSPAPPPPEKSQSVPQPLPRLCVLCRQKPSTMQRDPHCPNCLSIAYAQRKAANQPEVTVWEGKPICLHCSAGIPYIVPNPNCGGCMALRGGVPPEKDQIFVIHRCRYCDSADIAGYGKNAPFGTVYALCATHLAEDVKNVIRPV